MPIWAKAFNIDLSEYTKWDTLRPKSQSVLQWALLQKKIDPSEYLKWARNQYELISIKDDFFQTEHLLKEFTRWKDFHAWSSSCYPIYQWQDVLFVGCLEPGNLPEMIEVRPVLCSATALLKYWQSHHSNQQTPKVVNSTQKESPSPVSKLSAPAFDFSNLAIVQTGFENDSSQQTQSSIDLLPPEPAPAIDAQTFSHESLNSLDLQTPRPSVEKSNPWANHIFSELSALFEDKMILTFDSSGALKPTFWNGRWTPQNEQNAPSINVVEPNIFRIAYTSQRPFHGVVSPNKVNDDFFNFWYGGRYPEQITLQPVIVQEKVIGMILATSRDPQSQSKKLRLMQNIALQKSANFSSAAA